MSSAKLILLSFSSFKIDKHYSIPLQCQTTVCYILQLIFFLFASNLLLLLCRDCLKEKKQQEETLVVEIENTKSRMSEVNEELNLIRSELQNAGIDNHEGKRQQKRAEVLEHLKRLYPDSVVIRSE